MIRFLVTIGFSIWLTSGFAQEVVRVKGTAEVVLQDNLSKDEAREKARQLAKISAIEDRFGTYVEQDSDVEINDGKADFRIIGRTRVKGDWLKTTHEKFKEEKRRVRGIFGKSETIWISCTIEGLVREIRNPEITLDIMPLNCRDLLCRTYDFRDGESMYLHFKSPANGYLSVYAVQQDHYAYRLLPYQTMKGDYHQSVPVVADKEYLFFASEEEYDFFPGFSYLMIDELEMTTVYPKEFLDLFVVFSPNPFGKPVLAKNSEDYQGGDLPDSMLKTDFDNWLTENRIYDPFFQVKRITLTILK